eukprot:1156871-Pelagomonas_calceolata.AAC.1
MSDSKNLVEPIGAGITNTIGRAELAAIAAALTHKHTHVATDSLSPLHQLRKQILYPEKHRHHVQGDVSKKILDLAHTSQETIAKYQASIKGNTLTDACIPSAGPGGNPFYNIAWLAQEEARPSRLESSLHSQSSVLPDLKDALKSHMHAKHRLGYADCKTGHYNNYQSLLPHTNKGISNAFWNINCITTRMKRIIFQYRTGTLYNQKHAVCFKRFSSLVCPPPGCHHMDSALHILSGCQCPDIRNMVTERHNIASIMILIEVSKGSYGSNLIRM